MDVNQAILIALALAAPFAIGVYSGRIFVAKQSKRALALAKLDLISYSIAAISLCAIVYEESVFRSQLTGEESALTAEAAKDPPMANLTRAVTGYCVDAEPAAGGPVDDCSRAIAFLGVAQAALATKGAFLPMFSGSMSTDAMRNARDRYNSDLKIANEQMYSRNLMQIESQLQRGFNGLVLKICLVFLVSFAAGLGVYRRIASVELASK